MNRLSLSPISDPDELRKEAAVSQSESTTPMSSFEQPPVAAGPSEVQSATPSQDVSPQPIVGAVGVDNRAEKVTSVYPSFDSAQSKVANPATNNSAETYEKPYAYAVPAGIFIIVSWAIVYALLSMFPVLSILTSGIITSSLRNIGFSLATVVAVGIISYGLLQGRALAYWAAIVGVGLVLLDTIINLVRLGLFTDGNFYGLGWVLLVKPLVLVGVLIYLTRPKVAHAFY